MHRRDFLSRGAATGAGLALGAGVLPRPARAADKADASAPPAKPNIVVILVDDMGYSDLGCYGGEIRTPTIDRLAARGLRFTQFYNTAKCGPTRATLMTGLYYPEVGEKKLRDCVTLAEGMKQAGYFTAMSGKWHLTGQPTERGFDRYFGHLSGATNFFIGNDSFRLNGEKFDVPKSGFYTTDAFTDYAIRFLDEGAKTHPDKPFLLYLAYNAPHYPLQAPKEEVEKYLGKYMCGWDELRTQRYARQKKMGLFAKPWTLSPRPADVPAWDTLDAKTKKTEDLRMATFAGMVDRVDQNVGRLMAHLDKMGVADNTLVLFLSDNGACPFQRSRNTHLPPWDAGSYWTYDQKWAHAGNTPFRWYKQNQHEGGIATPLVVHWPKGLTVKGGSVTHQQGHLIDIMATCLDVGGGTYPKEFGGHAVKPLRGKSLLPIFRGKQRQGHDALYFKFSNNRAVRKGPWKLVSARGGPWELYDMSVDRTELKDLSQSKPERAKELADLWDAWAKEVGTSMPNKRPGGRKGKKTKPAASSK